MSDRCGQGQSAPSPGTKPERKQERSDSLRTEAVDGIQLWPVLTRCGAAHPLAEAEKNGAQHLRRCRLQHSPLSATRALKRVVALSARRTPSWSQSSREGGGRDLPWRGGGSF